MSRQKLIYLLPILLFAGLMAVAAIPLLRGDNPAALRSALLEQTVPAFTRAEFSSGDLKGRITLVNFFASWCPPCEAEHGMLMDLKANTGIAIYGVNYKDSDSGRLDYLQRLGNPYAAITPDPKGELAILWGTYGVPETFVIDKNGIIRYRHTAPLTPEDVKTILIPLIREIQ